MLSSLQDSLRQLDCEQVPGKGTLLLQETQEILHPYRLLSAQKEFHSGANQEVGEECTQKLATVAFLRPSSFHSQDLVTPSLLGLNFAYCLFPPLCSWNSIPIMESSRAWLLCAGGVKEQKKMKLDIRAVFPSIKSSTVCPYESFHRSPLKTTCSLGYSPAWSGLAHILPFLPLGSPSTHKTVKKIEYQVLSAEHRVWQKLITFYHI